MKQGDLLTAAYSITKLHSAFSQKTTFLSNYLHKLPDIFSCHCFCVYVFVTLPNFSSKQLIVQTVKYQ